MKWATILTYKAGGRHSSVDLFAPSIPVVLCSSLNICTFILITLTKLCLWLGLPRYLILLSGENPDTLIIAHTFPSNKIFQDGGDIDDDYKKAFSVHFATYTILIYKVFAYFYLNMINDSVSNYNAAISVTRCLNYLFKFEPITMKICPIS